VRAQQEIGRYRKRQHPLPESFACAELPHIELPHIVYHVGKKLATNFPLFYYLVQSPDQKTS
jgi:hypothetical protein